MTHWHRHSGISDDCRPGDPSCYADDLAVFLVRHFVFVRLLDVASTLYVWRVQVEECAFAIFSFDNGQRIFVENDNSAETLMGFR